MNMINIGFEADPMYELATQEIDMVAGGSLSSSVAALLSNVVNGGFAGATVASLGLIATVYNGAATLIDSINSGLGTDGVAGGVAGAATGLVNGILTAEQTERDIAALPAGVSILASD